MDLSLTTTPDPLCWTYLLSAVVESSATTEGPRRDPSNQDLPGKMMEHHGIHPAVLK